MLDEQIEIIYLGEVPQRERANGYAGLPGRGESPTEFASQPHSTTARAEPCFIAEHRDLVAALGGQDRFAGRGEHGIGNGPHCRNLGGLGQGEESGPHIVQKLFVSPVLIFEVEFQMNRKYERS